MSRGSDRKFELALKHELRSTRTPDQQSCIDAETLGAWADGGLDAAQTSAVELHVSTCPRCQAIVAATARSAPVITSPPRESIFRFPKWALAPLAAAAALTIWMVVPQDTIQAPPAPPQIEAPKQETVPPPARDASVQQQVKESVATTEPKPAAVAADKLAEGKRERTDPSPSAFEDRQQRAEERGGTALGAAAAPAPLGAAPPAPAASRAATLQKSGRVGSAPLEIVSPDPSSRWRIVNNSIERSEDAGTSWTPILAPGGERFSGGVSPSRSVCWLIGSNGLVMVTADGVAFARVPLPERVDLTSIAAIDARSATVTTVDGRRFETGDSGRTWRQI